MKTLKELLSSGVSIKVEGYTYYPLEFECWVDSLESAGLVECVHKELKEPKTRRDPKGFFEYYLGDGLKVLMVRRACYRNQRETDYTLWISKELLRNHGDELRKLFVDTYCHWTADGRDYDPDRHENAPAFFDYVMKRVK